MHFFVSLAQEAQIDVVGSRHKVWLERRHSERESKWVIRANTFWDDTLPKSLATVLEKRLLLNFTGNKVQKGQIRKLQTSC